MRRNLPEILIRISLMIRDDEHLFMCCGHLLWKNVFSVPPPINHVVSISGIEWYELFYIFSLCCSGCMIFTILVSRSLIYSSA